jgi:hypothetical protein
VRELCCDSRLSLYSCVGMIFPLESGPTLGDRVGFESLCTLADPEIGIAHSGSCGHSNAYSSYPALPIHVISKTVFWISSIACR